MLDPKNEEATYNLAQLKLQESDWRTNNDYPYDNADAWAAYRAALRNLPAEIAAGNVTAPTIENNSLIFNDWPEVPA